MAITRSPYPLDWPVGTLRTRVRVRSKFKDRTVAQALESLRAELKRFGALSPVISTNVEVRLDGLPYSGRREPDDPGVAVYFSRYHGGRPQPYCMAIDHYRKVADNLHALAKVIEAYREIERHGGPTLLGQATAGFLALPQTTGTAKREWWQTLGFLSAPSTYEEAHRAYRDRISGQHTDKAGRNDNLARELNERTIELNRARDQAKAHFGVA